MTNENMTSLLRSIPLAVPPPGARERVQARLARAGSRRAPPRPWLTLALCGAVAALAFVTFPPRRAPSNPARLLQVAGEVALVEDGRRSDGLARAELDAGAWVETARGQVLAGAAHDFLVLAMEDTRFRVERRDGDIVVHLAKGQVNVWSAPRSSGLLWVATPYHRAAVIGTIFSVQFTDGERFAVARGTVDVYAEDQRVARLSAGQSWASGLEPAAVSPQTQSLLERASRGQRIDLSPVRAEPPARPSEMQAPATPPTATVSQAAQRVAPKAKVRSVAAPAAAVATRRPADPPRAAPPTPESRADRLAREAETLEQSGDYRGAASRYESLARENGLDAEWALYRLGKLRERHLGDREGALRAWLEHRRRFPNGSLRQEGDLSIVETLVRLRRNGEALAEVEGFLARYPSSERRGEMEGLRERLRP